MVKLFGALALIGGVCGVLLTGTNTLTAEHIQLNRQAESRALMAAMLGRDLAPGVDIDADQFGRCGQWLFQRIEANGYAGPIEVLALWQSAGFTLRVTRHRETPGIGDFIDHRRDPWITRFDAQPIETFTEADNVSGATITTAAMQRAARAAAEALERFCG